MAKKPNGYWTEARCMESAAPYQTRGEWAQGDASAYKTTLRNGWLNECCAHMTPQLRSHTLESCMESAEPHQTRVDWQRGDKPAYAAALRNGWLDKCCAHMTLQLRSHTLESCMGSAAPYQTKVEWKQGDASAYQTAQQNGWLDECCAHMTPQRQARTLNECKASAAPYQTRSEWRRGDPPAYQAALRNGWLDECCAHMVDASPSDADTVYIWQAVGLTQGDRKVYKVGITSDRLGDQRIREVATAARLTPRKVISRCLGRWNTFTLEDHLLTFGEPVKFAEPTDGYTEFRALTDEELATMVRVVEAHPIL